MPQPHIQVILGTIRENRAGEKVARWFMDFVKQNSSATFELVDLKEYPLPMFADGVSPSSRVGSHDNPDVQKWLDKVASADGYIIVSPEYNHSYSSVLKNALDYGFMEWTNKPVGFVGYGGSVGGARAIEHLRLVVAELGMYSVRDNVTIPAVWAAFDEQGNLKESERHAKVAAGIVTKVVTLAQQLKTVV